MYKIKLKMLDKNYSIVVLIVLLLVGCTSNTYKGEYETIKVSNSYSVVFKLPEEFKQETIGVSKWGVDIAKTYIDSMNGASLEVVFFKDVVSSDKEIELNAVKVFEVFMHNGSIENRQDIKNDYFTGVTLAANKDYDKLFVYVGQNKLLKLSIRVVLRGKKIPSNYFSQILNSFSIK